MALKEQLQELGDQDPITERRSTILIDNTYLDPYAGHIHHTGPLHYLEAERRAILEEHEVDAQRMAQEEGLYGFVYEATIKWSDQMMVGDEVEITSRVFQARPTLLRFHQKIAKDGKTLVEAVIDTAIVNNKGRPHHIPQELVAKLRT